MALTLVLAAVSAVAGAVGNDRLDDWQAVEDSLRQVPPRLRYYWLRDRGLEDWYNPVAAASDSQGLSCVGRWSYGPAYDVDGRILPGDTLLALARGSGVSLVRFSRLDGLSLEVLADVNCDRLTGQVLIRDTLLYVASYGLEVYGISDPTHPVRHSRLATSLLGFDVKDTLVYVTSYDSFKVYSAADPTNLRLVGACRDSGAAVAVAGGTAVLGGSNNIHLLDVTDPTSPHRVGQYPGWALAVAARNTICCITFGNPSEPSEQWFEILDISAPGSPRRLGRLDDAGGNDICLDGPVAFLSGFYSGGHEFRILDISDSTAPSAVGTCATLSDNYGVWGTLAGGVAQVADNYGGLAVIDIGNPSQPEVDSIALRVGYAMDVSIDGNLCYVASDAAGLKVLDVTDPTAPVWIGDLDTAHNNLSTLTLVARDSFVFTCWRQPYLRTVDVTDPTSPRMAGACAVTARPEDMVLRDSFLYVAEDDLFQVINVARPREPEVVGTLSLPWDSRELILADTLAYISNFGGVLVVSIARPQSPYLVGTWPRLVTGIDLQDTILYALSYTNPTEDVLLSLSVADPAAPHLLDSVIVRRTMHDVVVVDTVAYCVGWWVQTVNVADPSNMVVTGQPWSPVSWVRRAAYEPPYLYLCCTDGGVCVLETLQTAVAEPPSGPRVRGYARVSPSVTAGRVRLEALGMSGPARVGVFDAAGRLVDVVEELVAVDGRLSAEVDLSLLRAGVYMIEVRSSGETMSVKVVKTQGR